jgi:hypothetical protein
MFTSTATNDEQLMGAEITFGTTLIGHVEGLLRDPLSQRVRRLITSYGPIGRRVAVPMEWVTKRSASRLVLAVRDCRKKATHAHNTCAYQITRNRDD